MLPPHLSAGKETTVPKICLHLAHSTQNIIAIIKVMAWLDLFY